ncbi:MAG: 2-C-methyl-D-erythritol 4-phosphate cytidylyltransferase [Betaproteobacteria bacterium]|nr:2-C-methyl-D-erythritol 4-phosphate cytidylyltransferase [Betaproteobacteria bacterium]
MSTEPAKNIWAVVPAAGSGLRMGCTVPKQYVELHGRPMVWHSVQTLRSHPKVHRVVIAIDEEDRYWDSLRLSEALADCIVLRCGGNSRAQTVFNALNAMADRVQAGDWVLVHDAARPCLVASALNRLFHEAMNDEVGGLLALPVRDTLKRAQPDGRVDRTEPREGFWQAQTPQLFRYAMLARALAAVDLASVTDEASAIEALGMKPKLVHGSARNIKVTYPDDVALAQMFLAP